MPQERLKINKDELVVYQLSCENGTMKNRSWEKNTALEQEKVREPNPIRQGVDLLMTRLSEFVKTENIQIEHQQEKLTEYHAIIAVRSPERFTEVKARLNEIAENINRFYEGSGSAIRTSVTGDEKGSQIDIIII